MHYCQAITGVFTHLYFPETFQLYLIENESIGAVTNILTNNRDAIDSVAVFLNFASLLTSHERETITPFQTVCLFTNITQHTHKNNKNPPM